MGRSNNAVLARRISADEQLYKDSTDKGSQQETVVAAPKMTPDLCSCLLQIVFQRRSLLGDGKHLLQVIETSHFQLTWPCRQPRARDAAGGQSLQTAGRGWSRPREGSSGTLPAALHANRPKRLWITAELNSRLKGELSSGVRNRDRWGKYSPRD